MIPLSSIESLSKQLQHQQLWRRALQPDQGPVQLSATETVIIAASVNRPTTSSENVTVLDQASPED